MLFKSLVLCLVLFCFTKRLPRVYTHNVFALPTAATHFDRWLDFRAQERLDALFSAETEEFYANFDIIVLTELFQTHSTKDTKNYQLVKEALARLGFAHATNTADMPRRLPKCDKSTETEETTLKSDGGVAVFSRWPIVETDMCQYRHKAFGTSDSLAAKGVVHARIKIPATEVDECTHGADVHIFATHTQADEKTPPKREIKARMNQISELGDFAATIVSPETSDFVFFVGDFNIDREAAQDALESRNASPKAQFRHMCVALAVAREDAERFANARVSFDTRNNSILRIVAARDGVEQVPQHLDYVLPTQATTEWTRLKCGVVWQQQVFETKILPLSHPLTGEVFDDASDHYAVASRAVAEDDDSLVQLIYDTAE